MNECTSGTKLCHNSSIPPICHRLCPVIKDVLASRVHSIPESVHQCVSQNCNFRMCSHKRKESDVSVCYFHSHLQSLCEVPTAEGRQSSLTYIPRLHWVFINYTIKVLGFCITPSAILLFFYLILIVHDNNPSPVCSEAFHNRNITQT